MEEVFVWFYRAAERPKGVPFHLNTMLAEQFKPSNPMPGFDYPWVRYNPYKMDFPPSDPDLRLPEHLFLIVKKEREVLFDFMFFKNDYKIVSSEFLAYLKENGVRENYELAKLSVVNTSGKSITKKNYYALRFGRFDDNLLSFHESTKVSVADLPNRYVYPDLANSEKSDKNIFFLNSFCYQETVVMSAKAKQEIENNFYCPEIYSAADFARVYKEDNEW